MGSRTKRRRGKKAERGGRISEGKITSSIKGYKVIAERKRVGGREIDRIIQRGKTIAHFETTKTSVTLPKMKEYWEKYINTRISTGANKLFVHGGSYTKGALEFAEIKKIRIV